MPEKPSSAWWDQKYEEVKKGNPDYSDEQIRKTVGDIWYNKMSPAKKQKELKKSEGSEKKQAAQTIFITIPDNVEKAILGSDKLKNTQLYGLVSQMSPNKEIEVAKDEAEAIKEGLLMLLQSTTDETLGEVLTDMLMDIDEALFSDATQEDLGADVDEAIGDAIHGLDNFFKESKTAAGFPNLFGNDTKKWIQLQTTNLAAKKGTPATPEQAQAYIDAAATQVAQELAAAIEPEVRKVVEEFREKIFQDVTSGVELQQPVKTAVPVAPSIEGTPEERKEAMKKALKRAFDNSYAYDAVAFVLQQELGNDYISKFAADEIIDEEEAILDIVSETFPKLARTELSDAFGNVLTDVYSIEN